MRYSLLALAIVAATSAMPVSSTNPKLKFVEFTTKHACVCSPNTAVCRCFIHLVFAVTPSQFTNTLIGGGSYAYASTKNRGGELNAGRDMKSERHLITGVCNCNATFCDYSTCDNSTGTAQMWNWGFEEVVPIAEVEKLPKTICPSVWIKDLTSGGQSQMSLECLPMPVTKLPSSTLGLAATSGINSFSSAATSIANKETGLSRHNIHIVFTVAPKDPTNYLIGGAMYSWDKGKTWKSQSTEVYYEQHIDASTDGRWNQAWQFDYDQVDRTGSQVPSEACFKVWLTDTNTMETIWLNATGEKEMHCMPICTSLVQFHWPRGYCPGATIVTKALP